MWSSDEVYLDSSDCCGEVDIWINPELETMQESSNSFVNGLGFSARAFWNDTQNNRK